MQNVCIWKKNNASEDGVKGRWVGQGELAFQFAPYCPFLEIDKERRAKSIAANNGYELSFHADPKVCA